MLASSNVEPFLCKTPKPQYAPGVLLTLALCQQLFCHEPILSVPQDKGKEGEDQSVQNAHNSQDVGPTHGTGPQAVFVCLLSAHPPDLIAVPTVGIDHATEHQTDT